MLVKILKRQDEEFGWIVGHTFKVMSETKDRKGYYIILLIGICRVEKEEVIEVR